SHEPAVLQAAQIQADKHEVSPTDTHTLLLLPGSRKGEVRALIEPFRESVEILQERGQRLRLLLPTVPNVAELVGESVKNWKQVPEILLGSAEKWRAFGEADASLIASGTVSLELALCGVP